ncbi:MAG TPA: cation:proton antiporter [Bacteroidia bacterium]
MVHLPNLISDLALILTVAAIISLLFKKLKQPVVLGYIIAGVFVGPYFKLFPSVIDVENIRTWADIGVIFLLFSLGLEFSFKKLVKVGSVAILTAFIGVSMTLLTGYTLGFLMGWNTMDSLFLGGILAISSTTIIIRAYDELKLKSQNFAGIVTGILVVEDLVAVVLMVVLSSVAVSRSFEGTEMLISMLKLVFFLVLWFTSGIFFIPTLLRKIKKLLNEESLLVLSLALCFIMVWLATQAGYSSALGAFIMGSILAETTKAEKIEHLLSPLKNMFGAIFFVSVGMLIEPNTLLEHAFPIALATLVLIFGKPFFVTIGALLSGQPLKTSVQSGMSLSQIGEFSFIIAGLGLSLKVTSGYLYPVAVAVSVITTFTTPYMLKVSEPMYHLIRRKMPLKWMDALDRYSGNAESVTHISDFRKLFRFYMTNVVIFSVVILSIILLTAKYLAPILETMKYGKLAIVIFTLLVLSPFLWALAFRRTQRELYANVWQDESRRGPLVVLMVSRILLAILFIGFLLDLYYTPLIALIGMLPALAIMILLAGKIKKFYGKIEKRFIVNMNERELLKVGTPLTPWDSHIAELVVPENSDYVGKTLEESEIREMYGINIAKIVRGGTIIKVPGRFVRLYPNDKISVIGTDNELKRFESQLNHHNSVLDSDVESAEIALSYLIIEPGSNMIGKSVRDSNIRELSKGMVVGIERGDQRILNPSSNEVFQNGDKVWIVGNSQRVKILTQH